MPEETMTALKSGTPSAEIDSGKRSFLRLLGLAGLGVVASQAFPSQAKAYVLGGAPTSPVVGSKDSNNVRINPAKEDGNLATVASNTAGLAKESGGNLDTIQANTTALAGLISGGALMTTGGGGAASIVGLKDTTSATINPATDDAVIYLRRLVHQVDALATVDSAQRQRITIDAANVAAAVTVAQATAANLNATVSIAAAQTLATITTVGTVTTVTSLTGLAGVDARYLFIDTARNTYAAGVRANLNYS